MRHGDNLSMTFKLPGQLPTRNWLAQVRNAFYNPGHFREKMVRFEVNFDTGTLRPQSRLA
jgi:hypothetical protein